MKLKTKAALLSFLWLIGILFPLTSIIYLLYAKSEQEEALESVQQASSAIMENILPSQLVQTGNSQLLKRYLTNHTMIRTLDQSSTVKNQAQRGFEFPAIQPKITLTPESYTEEFNHQIVMIVRTPILQDQDVIGTLELITVPVELQQSLLRLFSIMCIVTLIAIFFSISASFLLSKMLFLPISRIIQAMKNIEASLEIKKLPLDRKSKDELFQLSETFNHLMERIEASMQKQRQFISDASHEFKTSLTIMDGYTSLMSRWGYESMDLHQEALHAVQEECARMKQVTYQLLELAKLEHEGRLIISKFDLVKLCNECIQLLQPLTSKVIELSHDQSSILLQTDLFKLKQLIFIILDNALKYGQQHIDIYLSTTPSSYRIKIKDDGIGIPPEELPLVFERFYRVDRSRSRQTGGSGLGLSIAQRLIIQLKGTIEISSELEAGTIVTLTLPLS
ncbi:sensor histidine kinase [Paenibacillus alba]|uniref:histidine kinase n=1 Tax=Paenibacillus alba TaxID=1197127 RepID=A0ABU6G272_9BACL|nr:HAMP domain-containing sensor histidine kinase [Paenibacillus alba]MEC0227774.1 HAMP domain-containing sensor histidine kinase [Paenibacillus alba]